MSATKHPPDWKIYLVKKYLSGEGSYDFLAEAHGINGETLRRWVFFCQCFGFVSAGRKSPIHVGVV